MKKKSKAAKNTSSTEELPKKRNRKRKKSINWKSTFMVGALVLAMISFILSSIPTNFTSSKSSNSSSSTAAGTTPKKLAPEFKKEGTLKFLKADGSTAISNIDIELANTDAERAQGLMYRRYMEQNRGMLFIMETQEAQSFYMRNTHISLDIIYVDDQKTVVSIAKNTVPLSEESLFSEGPALYVVEVNAGYCDQYGIKPGDKIEFDLMNQ